MGTPGFTAEIALRPRGGYGGAATAAADAGAVLLQQRGEGELLSVVPPTACTCPCCVVHKCGFLGLYDCVTCC